MGAGWTTRSISRPAFIDQPCLPVKRIGRGYEILKVEKRDRDRDERKDSDLRNLEEPDHGTWEQLEAER